MNCLLRLQQLLKFIACWVLGFWNLLIIDVKSVEQVLPVHAKQVLTYLQQTKSKLGLLLNFNVPVRKDGIHRIVMGLEE